MRETALAIAAAAVALACGGDDGTSRDEGGDGSGGGSVSSALGGLEGTWLVVSVTEAEGAETTTVRSLDGLGATPGVRGYVEIAAASETEGTLDAHLGIVEEGVLTELIDDPMTVAWDPGTGRMTLTNRDGVQEMTVSIDGDVATLDDADDGDPSTAAGQVVLRRVPATAPEVVGEWTVTSAGLNGEDGMAVYPANECFAEETGSEIFEGTFTISASSAFAFDLHGIEYPTPDCSGEPDNDFGPFARGFYDLDEASGLIRVFLATGNSDPEFPDEEEYLGLDYTYVLDGDTLVLDFAESRSSDGTVSREPLDGPVQFTLERN